MIKATVVIPNFNGKHFLINCMHALEGQTSQEFETLVVDNGSSDGSYEWLKKWQQNDEAHRHGMYLNENTGFSGAVNLGIEWAIKRKRPYVILLNNDTEVDPDFVHALIHAMEKPEHKKVFSYSSKMVCFHERKKMDDAGDRYSVLGWQYQRGVGQPAERFKKDTAVFTACAGAAIYRTSVFEEIGEFDLKHFAYLEDIDVGYRARLYGYENRFCPEAVCYHIGSGTSGSKYNDFKVKLSARNTIYLLYKNMPNWQIVVNSPALFLGILVKQAFFIKKGFGKAYMAGIIEGLKTASKCKRVNFSKVRLKTLIGIELELLFGAFDYIREYIRRRQL